MNINEYIRFEPVGDDLYVTMVAWQRRYRLTKIWPKGEDYDPYLDAHTLVLEASGVEAPPPPPPRRRKRTALGLRVPK